MLERVQRRLAAILAADVVGYSRLIGQDEAGTLRRLKELRRGCIDPTIKDHQGRIVKTTGDGMLIEFPSAVEAVRCAVAVQRAIAQIEAKAPPDHQIAFRIGVHQGDVVVDSDDLFGDGVNVAARLQTLGEAGGVCVSGRVYEDTVGRLDLPFEDRGEQRFKNIARPIRVYSLGTEAITRLPLASNSPRGTPPSGIARWLGGVVGAPSRLTNFQWRIGLLLAALVFAGIGTWLVLGHSAPTNEQAASPRGPTLAVLPFNNLSGDPSQEFFADGLSEELITVLSRFELRVLAQKNAAYGNKAVDVTEIGRALQAQYVIEGSFRRVPDKISVTTQLIDVPTGSPIWAQTYERPTASTSLLAIQDEIAQLIGAAVGDIRIGAISRAELERARTKPAAELSSYECVLQGYRASTAPTDAEAVQRARACLNMIVKRDPLYAEAWSILPRVLYVQRLFGTGLAPPDADDIDKRAYLVPLILEAGKRAVELAPESASAHFGLALAYYATCQPERMRIEVDRALSINPNDVNTLGTLGNELAFAGDWDYGRQLAEKGLALAGPAAPHWWWWAVAKDYYRKGEYAKALEFFRRAYDGQNWLDHLHLVYTLPYLGRIDDARAQIPILLKLYPKMSVREADRFYKTACFDADFRARMDKALRLAGLREE